MRILLASTCLTPLALLAFTLPAHAETVIDTKSTAAAATATIKAGGPDDIRIAAAGSVTTTSGSAVTLNSPNKVTNEGTIQITGANDANGILAIAGAAGTIASSGKIIVDETFAPVDTDKDGDLDGPFATGVRRAAIRTAGAFTGTIANTGGISVRGNDSAGIALGGPLTGNFTNNGTIDVAGDRAIGVQAGAISGNVRLAGAISAQGLAASAAVIGGDVGGALVVQGSLAASGYRYTPAPADVSKLDADDLLQGGPALVIAGNVAGGVILAVAPKDLDAKEADEDKDGIPDATEGSASVQTYGAAAAVQIGAAGRDIAIGAVTGVGSGAASSFGLVIDGTVAGNGVYKDVDARGLVIGGLGGKVAIVGGIAVNSSVQATSLNGTATAIRIGSGASVPEIKVAGTVAASGSNKAGTASMAIAIDAGAAVASIRNSGTIKATALGTDGAATAIADRSGSLALVENSGAITAAGAAAGHNIAIDLRANTIGTIVRQIAGATGAAAPSINGDILFGSGNDTLSLAGKSSLVGTVDFGGGNDQMVINENSRFAGSIANSRNLALTVNSGTLALDNKGIVQLGSLSVGGQGVIGVTVDGATKASTAYDVTGTASFAAGSKVAVTLTSVSNAEGKYVIVKAAALDGLANLGTSATQLPWLFKSSIGGGGAGEVVLSLSRKSATELGLNGSEAGAYEAVVKALDSDAKVAGAFLDIADSKRFGSQLRQMLPDHAGGAFDAVTQASRATARMFADPSAPNVSTDRGRAWLQQVAWGRSKSVGNTAGFDVSGFGFNGGGELDTDVGSFGVSGALLYGNDNDGDTDNKVNSNQYELAGHWHGNWGGFSANARVSGALINFNGTRHFDGAIAGTAVTRDTSGKWNGRLLSASSGVSYEISVGRLAVRPVIAVDYYHLHEGSYTEAGGGKAFDLKVGSRNSDELTVSPTLAVALKFGGASEDASWFRTEIEGGRRQIIGGSLGATTASFAGGQAFTLTPEDRTNGWVGRIRAVGGSGGFKLAGEVSGEQQQGRAALAARISASFAL